MKQKIIDVIRKVAEIAVVVARFLSALLGASGAGGDKLPGDDVA